MSAEIKWDRRGLLRTAALSVAATQLGLTGCAKAPADPTQLGDRSTFGAGTNSSFGVLKQINAGLLNVGYAEAGPAAGPMVILLHGWPYDIHSYVDVAPLRSAEHRCRS